MHSNTEISKHFPTCIQRQLEAIRWPYRSFQGASVPVDKRGKSEPATGTSKGHVGIEKERGQATDLRGDEMDIPSARDWVAREWE